MQPGDAMIVPNQLDFETWGRALVRNLKDWSQIFSQFGLGAAAIQTLQQLTEARHERTIDPSVLAPSRGPVDDEARRLAWWTC